MLSEVFLYFYNLIDLIIWFWNYIQDLSKRANL
jgi:hypothetical protein